MRAAGCPGHVVLDEHAVLEHRDLRPVALLADRHHAVHRLAAGQELRLGQDRRAGPALVTPVTPPLALGLQPGRAGDALHLVARRARLADLDDGHDAVIRLGLLATAGAAPTTLAPAAGHAVAALFGHVFVVVGGVGRRLLVVAVHVVVRTLASATSTATTTAAAPRRGGLAGEFLIVLVVGIGLVGCLGRDRCRLFGSTSGAPSRRRRPRRGTFVARGRLSGRRSRPGRRLFDHRSDEQSGDRRSTATRRLGLGRRRRGTGRLFVHRKRCRGASTASGAGRRLGHVGRVGSVRGCGRSRCFGRYIELKRRLSGLAPALSGFGPGLFGFGPGSFGLGCSGTTTTRCPRGRRCRSVGRWDGIGCRTRGGLGGLARAGPDRPGGALVGRCLGRRVWRTGLRRRRCGAGRRSTAGGATGGG